VIAIFTAAFVFALQTADDSAPTTASTVASEGTSALVDMLHHIGPIALLVLVVLAIASLYSWTIIFSKY
jgi:biopolymer transport protein TolQ